MPGLRFLWKLWQNLDGALALYDRLPWVRWAVDSLMPLALAVVGGAVAEGSGGDAVMAAALTAAAVGIPLSFGIRRTIRWAVEQRQAAVAAINVPHLSDTHLAATAAQLSTEVYAFLRERSDEGPTSDLPPIDWSDIDAASEADRRRYLENLHLEEGSALYVRRFEPVAKAVVRTAIRRGIVDRSRVDGILHVDDVARLLKDIASGEPSEVRRVVDKW